MDIRTRNKRVRKLEKHLRNYKQYKIGIQNLKKQLDYIMPDITVNYSVEGGANGTFNIASKTENYAIDRIESKKAVAIYEDMSKYKIIVESIDVAMNELDEQERKFIEMRYLDDKTITHIAMEFGYSDKHLYNLKDQIFDKLLISLKGLIQF